MRTFFCCGILLASFLLLVEPAFAQTKLSPAELSFGSLAVGEASSPKTATFKNLQKTPVTISGIVISGGNAPGDYSSGGSCPISPNTLASGATCSITVTFAPSALGNRVSTLTVTSNSSSGPQSIALSGTGVAPVTVLPTSLVFTNRLVGTPSAAKIVTLTNHLKTAVAISSVAASGDFAVATNGCGSNVAAGSECAIGVTFTPSGIGPRSGELTINYGAFGSPALVPLSGTGNDTGLTSIVIAPGNPSIAAGNGQQFAATGHFKNGSTENLTSFVTWSSSKTTVATITSAGMATGVTAGTTNIAATLGAVTGTTTLTVTPPIVVSIAVTPANPSIAKGATLQLTATGTYSDGSVQTVTNSVTWSSSNQSVATIATGGLATGVATGTSSVTAALGGVVSPSDSVTVTPATLVSIAVTPANPAIAKGTAEQFAATGTYSDGSSSDVTASATWSCSNPTVATISATGLASGVATGSTSVVASMNSISGTTSLTVNPAALTSISVTPASIYVGVGSNKQYTATGIYSDGSTANLTNAVTWSSNNPLIATISSTGLGTSTGSGAAILTATQGTLNGQATMNGVAGGFVSCDAHIENMQILVITNGGTESDFPAITQALGYIGTPYTALDISQTGETIPSGYLSNGCQGNFQGVIFAFGNDIYTISNISDLYTYESTFNVRQVNWYVHPDPNFGLALPSGNIDASPTPYNFYYAPAANSIFSYANVANPVGITNAYIYLSSTVNGSTPLLTDSLGNVLGAIYQTPFAGQYLSLTFDSNQYLLHDQVLAYGLINWVTQGIFLGDYHVYASPQVDDFFIDDSEWITGTSCQDPNSHDRTKPDASNLPVFRVNAADMTQLAAWQSGIQADPSGLFKNFQLTLAFNGVGTAGNGDWTGLTAPITATSANSDLVTFTTTDFSGLPGASVTVTGTTNDGGILNGTWTILSVASNSSTTPATTQFTAIVSGAGTMAQQVETGATAAVGDDLVANLQSYQGAFHWISHTYDHPTTLNGLCKSSPTGSGCGDIYDNPPTDDIDLEVLTNLWVASNPNGANLDNDPSDLGLSQLMFNDFNPGNMVTPGVSGLNDPNVPGYLNTDGINFVVTDTSVIGQNNNGPNPSPNVGIVNSFAPGLYEVPRHPNDIYYNVANWNDDQAEFDCIYSYPTQVPPFNTYTAAQILNFVSSSFLSNMLIGDMDPEMFHQPDLHFSINTAPGMPSTGQTSSLLADTYNQTFSLYKQMYNLPVLSPTLDQAGQAMQSRNAYNLSNVTASIIGAGGPNPTITVTMPSGAPVPTAIIPITGLNSTGAEVYGGQYISHISITPGQTVTLPAQ